MAAPPLPYSRSTVTTRSCIGLFAPQRITIDLPHLNCAVRVSNGVTINTRPPFEASYICQDKGLPVNYNCTHICRMAAGAGRWYGDSRFLARRLLQIDSWFDGHPEAQSKVLILVRIEDDFHGNPLDDLNVVSGRIFRRQ